MHRKFLKVSDAFPRSADEDAQQVARLLQHTRAGMNAAWEGLEEGWKQNNERMVRFGLSPRISNDGVVNLNVGGSNVRVCWHLFAEVERFKDSILGALLEGVWDKDRIPRDVDGLIVLDESPARIEGIIHAMLRATSNGRSSAKAVGLPESTARSAVAIEEAPCLIYTANVMGLLGSVPTHPDYMKMNVGSTTLEPFEIAPLSAMIRQWVGCWTDEMTLIYRATRDGFGGKAFTARCNENSPKTISLIRVSSGQGNGDDSVVGCYAVCPWGSAVGSTLNISKDMCVFMLKDGSATRKGLNKPIKWTPNPDFVGGDFLVPRSDGPYFGTGGLVTIFDEKSGSCTIQTEQSNLAFPIASNRRFLALNNRKVVDIEVYCYSTPAPSTTTAPSITEPGGDVLTDAEAHDIDSFGKVIASSLMEERVVLARAVKEMEAAGARVSAAVVALETVYGPSMAASEQDAVVELNVLGARMTSLRSTLQACPRSALAMMFNEDRWPATDRDKDEHGRRFINCDPTCFSNILDVLRMRKRASWSRGAAGGEWEEEGEEEDEGEAEGEGKEEGEGEEEKEEKEEEEEEESSNGGSGAVLIKSADVEAFGEAVNMYFPGCESFIMDLVQPV